MKRKEAIKQVIQGNIKEIVFNDPWQFLTYFVFTYDPDSKEKVRKFPDYNYIRFWYEAFENEQYLLILKSRQIFATWAFTAFAMVRAITTPGTFIILQSSKESKAGWGGTKTASDPSALLGRIEFMYEHLPPMVQEIVKIEKVYQTPMIVFTTEKGKSHIKAISSKETDFRQFPKGSIIIADEFAFQPEAQESFISAQPLIGREGKYIAITTASNLKFLHELIYGTKIIEDYPLYLDKYPAKINQIDELAKYFRLKIPTKYLNPLPYVLYWRNDKNFSVIATSLKTHPDYVDLEEEELKEKISSLKVLSPIEANREYFLDINVNLDQARIYTTFDSTFHIASNELIPVPNVPILRGWDFGRKHPCVIFAQKITRKNCEYPYGTLLVLKEVLGTDISLADFVNQILAISDAEYKGFLFKDYCDPISIKQTSDKSDYTAITYLQERGIFPIFQKKSILDGITMIDALFTHKIGGKYPFVLISPKCENLITGFQGAFRWDREGKKPQKDKYYEHFHDAFRYIVVMSYTPDEVFDLEKEEAEFLERLSFDVYDQRIREMVESKLTRQDNWRIRRYKL